MRASSSLMRCCSSGSVEALSWSANSKNRRFSASFDSSSVSISSTRTRFALVRWIFAKALTRLARREGSEICSDGQLFQWSSWLNCTLSCTTLHQSAKAARSTQTTSGGGGRTLLAFSVRDPLFDEIVLGGRECPHHAGPGGRRLPTRGR